MFKALRKHGRKRSEKSGVRTGRRVRFEAEYLKNNGNALQAARAVGYSEAYALARSYEWAREINVTLARVARARGLNEHRVIGKYEFFLDAKEPKWNQDSKRWDIFENSKVQLEATRDLAEIIEPRQSQTTFGAAMGHGKDGRPTLNVILHHTVGRPDRSLQAVKTLNIPTNGAAHADDDD